MTFSKRARALAFVGLALAAIAAYAPSLAGGFVWDDQALIVDNQSLRSWGQVGDLLTRDFFHLHDDPVPYGYYRPVITLTYLLEYQLWGLHPLGYHATNVILHAASTLLVALVLRRLRFDDGVSFAVALLFAVHPIHTENVSWIAGRTDLVAFVLAATAFLLHAIAAERDRTSPRLLLASTSLFALGLLSKEMSVVLIPWIFLLLWIVHRRPWRRIAIELSPYLLVFVAYFALRSWVLRLTMPGAPGDHGLSAVVWSAAPTIVRYLGWMLFPIDLNAYVQNPYARSAGDPRFLGALLLLGVLGAWAWRRLRRPEERLLLAMLLSAFLPILNFVRVAGPADMGNAMSERFAYFPSFPFLAILVLLATSILGALARPRVRLAATWALLAVAVLLGTAQTVLRTREWRDELVFVTRTLEQSPRAPLLWNLLAQCRLRRAIPTDAVAPEDRWRHKVSEAELRAIADTYRVAIGLDPNYLAVQHNLGATLHRLGDLDGAIRAFREATRINPGYVKARLNLGAALQDAGQTDAAVVEYRMAIEILESKSARPSSSSRRDLAAAHYNVGIALLGEGDREGALASLRQAVLNQPELMGALLGEARFRAERGDADSALAILEELSKLHPENAAVRGEHGRVLARLGRAAEPPHASARRDE